MNTQRKYALKAKQYSKENKEKYLAAQQTSGKGTNKEVCTKSQTMGMTKTRKEKF